MRQADWFEKRKQQEVRSARLLLTVFAATVICVALVSLLASAGGVP